MSLDLYGDYIFDAKYFAKKLISLGVNSPWYIVQYLPDYIDHRLSVKILDNNGNEIPLSQKKGYYVIYHRIPLFGIEEPIYAGFSRDSIHNRIRRFGIGLCNVEGLIKIEGQHSGGKKYKDMGGTRENLYVRFVLQDDIPFKIPNNEIQTLDEHLAVLLNTKCNTRRKF